MFFIGNKGGFHLGGGGGLKEGAWHVCNKVG